MALTRLLNMVFNEGDITNLWQKMSSDKELIESLGGSAKVAARLGYSVQRVQNWKERGIPAQVRLNNPDVFPLPRQGKTARAESKLQ